MLKITPIDNGLHSLAKGLEAFNKLHGNPADVFSLKDSILRTHHAIETLAKAILFEINPVFVLRDDAKIGKFISRYKEFAEGKNSFIVDDEFTIGLIDALDRLRGMGEIKQYPESEFSQLRNAAEELEKFRNAIQHFAIEANAEIVARVLGNIVPRFVDLLDVLQISANRSFGYGYSVVRFRHKTADLSGFMDKLVEIYPDSKNVIDLLRSQYDILIAKTIEFFSNKTFQNIVLSVKIKDYGKVGPPPYRPEVNLNGAFELALNSHQMLHLQLPADITIRTGGDNAQSNITSYEGSVAISNPVKTPGAQSETDPVVNGSIELRLAVTLRQPDSAIRLQDAGEYLPVLREIEIQMQASLKYEALVHNDSAHYLVQNMIHASGNLKLTISAVPSGYDSEDRKHLIYGILNSTLVSCLVSRVS